MQIRGDGCRRGAEQPQVGAQRLVVMAERSRTVEITDVRAGERIAVAEHAERVLEMRPEREHLSIRRVHAHRQWAVSACTPDHARCSIDDPHHRVVVARVDVPIVQKEVIGDAAQTLARPQSLSLAIGSSLTLPLVITSMRPEPRRRR